MELTQMMSSPTDGEDLAEVLTHFSSNSVVWNWSSDMKYFLNTKFDMWSLLFFYWDSVYTSLLYLKIEELLCITKHDKILSDLIIATKAIEFNWMKNLENKYSCLEISAKNLKLFLRNTCIGPQFCYRNVCYVNHS